MPLPVMALINSDCGPLTWLKIWVTVSTVIPGIRTPEQADLNATGSMPLPDPVLRALDKLPAEECERITAMMQAQG